VTVSKRNLATEPIRIPYRLYARNAVPTYLLNFHICLEEIIQQFLKHIVPADLAQRTALMTTVCGKALDLTSTVSSSALAIYF
jgi:hypothetical protein